jgi:hypothetical protein
MTMKSISMVTALVLGTIVSVQAADADPSHREARFRDRDPEFGGDLYAYEPRFDERRRGRCGPLPIRELSARFVIPALDADGDDVLSMWEADELQHLRWADANRDHVVTRRELASYVRAKRGSGIAELWLDQLPRLERGSIGW